MVGEFMSEDPHPSSVKAGGIAARVLSEVSQEIKPGVKLYKICTLAEKLIVKYGGTPAFPTNVSINHIAAHYTSPRNDRKVVPEFGLVKLDVGVHVDGHIADTALTVDLDGTLEGFVSATDDALDEAIKLMQPGVSLSDVGKEIERVVRAYGLRSIKQICGHNILPNRLHGGKKVPNGKDRTAGTVEVGEYYAIEPYATTGVGIGETKQMYIFSNTTRDEPLTGWAEKLRKHLREGYGPFPFALRWIGKVKKADVDILQTFKVLLAKRAVRGHSVLVEKKGRPVSQSEHTVFISDKGPIVLTKRN
jgi:methionyl aminopeptidase